MTNKGYSPECGRQEGSGARVLDSFPAWPADTQTPCSEEKPELVSGCGQIFLQKANTTLTGRQSLNAGPRRAHAPGET